MQGSRSAHLHPNLRLVQHPLIEHKLTILRDRETSKKSFRELVDEIGTLMAYEITKDLPLEPVEVETPLGRTTGHLVAGKKLVLVPILRAGLGMVAGVLRLIPSARVGHIGLYRDHQTLEPVQYYLKIDSNVEERSFILIDPMLATGGSASVAATRLKEKGARSIKFLCLVAAPEGLKRMERDHPDVTVYAAALDERLNDLGYIVPGLGDAGDRLFGTE
jgi:uracil phosphoribosyltransferase